MVEVTQTLFTGDASISGGVTLTVDIHGTSPQFTLTCISTGGPATTVAWTRDSTPVTEGVRLYYRIQSQQSISTL